MFVACGLNVVGERAEVVPSSASATDAASAAARAPDDASAPGDSAPLSDGGLDRSDATARDPAPEAGPSCSPMTVMNGVVKAGHANKPFTIDGDLADWACTTFHTFNGGDGGTQSGTTASTYAFAAAWDADNLYFAFRVTDATLPRGAEPQDVWKNDSVELYIATARRNGYATTDHTYVVDWQGRANEFNNPDGRHAPGAGFSRGVVANGNGMTVEMRVARAELGLGSLATTTTLFVDFAGNDLQTNGSDVWTTWYREPNCGCTIDKETDGFGALNLVP